MKGFITLALDSMPENQRLFWFEQVIDHTSDQNHIKLNVQPKIARFNARGEGMRV
jgi:hypothetical protein